MSLEVSSSKGLGGSLLDWCYECCEGYRFVYVIVFKGFYCFLFLGVTLVSMCHKELLVLQEIASWIGIYQS